MEGLLFSLLAALDALALFLQLKGSPRSKTAFASWSPPQLEQQPTFSKKRKYLAKFPRVARFFAFLQSPETTTVQTIGTVIILVERSRISSSLQIQCVYTTCKVMRMFSIICEPSAKLNSPHVIDVYGRFCMCIALIPRSLGFCIKFDYIVSGASNMCIVDFSYEKSEASIKGVFYSVFLPTSRLLSIS
jgi:hypothetical protein